MKFYISKLLIAFFCSINFPKICAWILYANTEKNNINNQFKILFFSKTVFNDDVKAIQRRTKKLTFIKFPRLLLSPICANYIKNFHQLNDANYHTDADKTKIYQLIKFLKIVIKEYKSLIDFDCVFSGNFVYTQQQELFIVLKELNIPTVVLYKEGMFPEVMYNEVSSYFWKTKKFRANLILVYNNSICNSLLNAKIDGLTQKNIKVVGIPRFDNYFKYKGNDNKNTITLFSFDPYSKNYLLRNKNKFDLFSDFIKSFHKNFANFCLNHKNFKLVVKTKASKNALDFTNSVFKNYKKLLGDRLIITSSISTEKLIKESHFIAGFSSTTIIESIMLKKKIICPNFPKSTIEKKMDLVYPYNNLCNYISNFTQLQNVLLQSEYKILDLDLRREFLEKKIYKNDGKSSQRVEKAILDQINY